MSQVIMRIGRLELYDRWAKVCNDLLRRQLENTIATLRLLALHLTWYNPSTGEFFSPVDPRVLDQKHVAIENVVILIDDVYDMFSRLQEKGGLYSKESIRGRAKLLSKLAYSRDTTYESLDDSAKDRLRLEATEVALSHLISWRRAEMIHAENIARYFGAELTVLGTKHSRSALKLLAGLGSTPKTYLSHRISEPRRMNKATNSLPTNLGQWSPTAREVNILHQRFAEHGQLLINPTAIDELRFADPARFPGRSPLLAARWPLPEPQSDLLWDPPVAGCEHTEMLSGGLEVTDPIATAVSRSLANQIFHDISFRDHLLVESTPNLCIYRPFFSAYDSETGPGVDWSHGVSRELKHWTDSFEFDKGTAARLGFVHTREEIRSRLRYLGENETARTRFKEGLRSHFDAMLLSLNITSEERVELYSGRIGTAEDSQLGFETASNLRDNADEVLKRLKVAATIQLVFFFSPVKVLSEADKPPAKEDVKRIAPYTLALVIEERTDRQITDETLAEVAADLCKFFAGNMTPKDVEDANRIFINMCIEEFQEFFDRPHEEYASELLCISYEELVAHAARSGVSYD